MILTITLLSIIGHRYYVSPTGDDANDGKSPNHAWRSLARIEKAALEAGDEILLSGLLEGNLRLAHGGTASHPVIVRSDRTQATILSKEGPGITVRTGGVEIRDLTLRGGASAYKEGHDGILLAAPAAQRSAHIRVERVDISGFGGSGISMTGEKGSPNGFDDVRISRSKIHENYGTGIITADGVAGDQKGFAHRGLVITDCDVIGNLGGNGIIISGVDGGTVEYCRSMGNRSEGGALGMWAWCARHVTFRYCIANGTRGKGDGGGYDLDGGTVECTVEHCLSFDNDGPGYMHCDYPDAPRTHGNVMRDSISIDDGRKAKGEPSGFGFVVWGSGLYDCVVERNLAILTKPDALKRENGALFATFIRYDKVPLEAQKLEGAIFRDNVVQISATGAALMRDNFPAGVPHSLTFKGNSFRTTEAAPFIDRTNRYETLAAWRAAVGSGDLAKPKPAIDAGDVTKLYPRDLPSFFARLGR